MDIFWNYTFSKNALLWLTDWLTLFFRNACSSMYAAISINFVRSKQKTTRQDLKVVWDFIYELINQNQLQCLPHPFSEDLCWRAIWMKEMLGYQLDEVAAALRMPPRTIKGYVSKVLNFREVKANTIGRPIKSVSMHLHMEFFIMEAVLKHREKTLQNLSNNNGNGNNNAAKQ